MKSLSARGVLAVLGALVVTWAYVRPAAPAIEAFTGLASCVVQDPGSANVPLPRATAVPPVSRLYLVRPVSTKDKDIDDCSIDEPPQPETAWPFDIARVTEVLERNEKWRASVAEPTHIAIIDTGVDPLAVRGGGAQMGDSAERTEPGALYPFVNPQAFGREVDAAYGTAPFYAPGYKEYFWHGTHVAALSVGGLGNSEAAKRLTALVRHLLKVRFYNVVSQQTCIGQEPDFFIRPEILQLALTEAAPAKIINLSVETAQPVPGVESALLMLQHSLVIAAAGNQQKMLHFEKRYPASFAEDLPRRVITVAAHDVKRYVPRFSNVSPKAVDLAAPGCRVNSLGAAGIRQSATGTSMAAPLVSFTAALLVADGLELREVKPRIVATVDRDEPEDQRRECPEAQGTATTNWPYDCLKSRGRLNIPRALDVNVDVIERKGGPPLRGRIVDLDIRLGDMTVPLAGMLRLIPLESNEKKWTVLAYRADMVQPDTPTPTSKNSFSIVVSSGETPQIVPFEQIDSVTFALGRYRPALESRYK